MQVASVAVTLGARGHLDEKEPGSIWRPPEPDVVQMRVGDLHWDCLGKREPFADIDTGALGSVSSHASNTVLFPSGDQPPGPRFKVGGPMLWTA